MKRVFAVVLAAAGVFLSTTETSANPSGHVRAESVSSGGAAVELVRDGYALSGGVRVYNGSKTVPSPSEAMSSTDLTDTFSDVTLFVGWPVHAVQAIVGLREMGESETGTKNGVAETIKNGNSFSLGAGLRARAASGPVAVDAWALLAQGGVSYDANVSYALSQWVLSAGYHESADARWDTGLTLGAGLRF